MIEGILKLLILTINECTKRITVLFCLVHFIFMQIFGQILAKMDIPEFNTSFMLTTISKKSFECFSLIQTSHMIEGILKLLILTINECTKRITVLFCLVHFIFMQIFGQILAKMDIPEFNTPFMLTTISKKSFECFLSTF